MTTEVPTSPKGDDMCPPSSLRSSSGKQGSDAHPVAMNTEAGKFDAAAEAMRQKREELIHQPLAFIWKELAKAALTAQHSDGAQVQDPAFPMSEAKEGNKTAFRFSGLNVAVLHDIVNPHLRVE